MRGVLALAILAGCGGDPTQLVVVVDTDLVVPAEIDEVRVSITGPSGEERIATEALTDGSELPLTLGVSPSNGSLGPITIVGEGRAEGTTVVTRMHRTSLVRGETRVLYLFLSRDCRATSCEEGETCTEAGCAPVDIDPSDLPAWTGTPPAHDGGTEADAGAPATCSSADDCDDRIGCTRDLCEGTTCSSTPDDTLCTASDDGTCDPVNGCQYPECNETTCVAGPCQTATCDASGTCVRTSLCASDETCCAGACVPAGCDDGNPCTEDSCGAGGCVNATSTATCDDAVFCNGTDTCSAGVCETHSGDPCLGASVCDESVDACTGCLADADCPAPVYGTWTTCGGYSSSCDEDGTRSRTVTTYRCSGGTCVGSDSTESEPCTRTTAGDTCGTSTCTWDACNYATECAESGSRMGTCTDRVCASGACTDSPRMDTSACSRSTAGAPCAGGCLQCAAGACAADPLSGWQPLGSALSGSAGSTSTADIAIDDQCRPVIAWNEDNLTYVRRWDGASWTALGSAIDAVTTSEWATGARIAVRGSGLYVLVAENTSEVHPYVFEWTGSAWTPVGGALPGGAMLSFSMDLAVDSMGRPIAAYNARDTATMDTVIFVARWSGSAWDLLASPLSAGTGTFALAPSIALDGDSPWIGWQEQSTIRLRRWTGSIWTPVGTGNLGSSSANDTRVALDGTGRFLVGWRQYNGMASTIHVQRWNGSGWSVLGADLSAGSGTHTSNLQLEVDPMDRPIIAWNEGSTTSDIYVRRHDGSGFTAISAGADRLSAVGGDTDALIPALAVDPLGRPIVVWSEEATAGGTRDIHVWRYHL